ncbi:cation:proton antiporter [Salirhabdus salicampi]|uniref:cation:proton antiporter n=1 Tax=Salirhabdus salicampi TaxID=476102 RepID=UPI0020C4865C|nr:cation:proton antiporter [Salirhabdus salicampi]
MHIDIPSLLGAGIVLIFIFWLGILSLKIKLPSVILYILLGIVLSQALYHNEILHFAGEIGIVLLFFLLGLEFSVARLGGIAKKIWSAGLLDVAVNFGFVILLCWLVGMDVYSSLLVGGVAYATSSSITAKLLDDTGRMANRETEFILALLIFEDIVAPIIIAILMALSLSGNVSSIDLLFLFGKIAVLAIGAILLGKFLFSKLGKFFDKIDDEEFKYAFYIGIALSYGGVALLLGLSEVLGAFLAGMMLAEVKRLEPIEHAVHPFRDLLLPAFFIYFGTTVQFGEGVPMMFFLLMLLLWSLVAKIGVGYFGGQMYGLSKRVSFRAGLSLCARGEFSVVIASLAAGTIKVFAGIYIITAAFLGMLLFQQAPKLTNLIFGKPKRKKQENLRVPGT